MICFIKYSRRPLLSLGQQRFDNQLEEALPGKIRKKLGNKDIMVDTQNGKQTKGPLYLILGISVAFVAAVIPFFPSSFRRNISNSLPFMPTTNAKKKQVIELLLSSKNSIKTGQKMVDLGRFVL